MNRPCILWIVTTQWRAQACGFAGDPNARTPRMDALASRSTDFTQAVTPHPFGPFARAAMLTGRPSPENGIRDYFDPLPGGSATIARALAACGYATAFFGKWHLGRRDRSSPPVGEAHAKTVVPAGDRGGFDFWEGFESGFLLNDPWLHGSRLPEPARFEGYQSDVLCRRAAGWIQGRAKAAGAEQPWFCVVSLEPPHPPYQAPASGIPPRDPREIVLPPNVPRGGGAEARARRELAGYYAHIEATDRAAGLLVSAVSPDAIIAFTSVHGDMHGAHGLFRKGWPHEESVRVPLLVRLPAENGGPSGTKTAGAVSLLDLPRWTAAWAGLPPGNLPLPALPPELRLMSMPSVAPFPHQCDRPWRGVRTPRRKLILNPDGTPWLYFDLEADPFETANLAADPSRAGEIRDLRGSLDG